MKPRLLDLFCGAGGAGMGYHRAGFEVVGVDIKPQPHYPFEFHQADALTFPLEGFDAIHASPPCQAYSIMRHLPWLKGRDYWDSIPPTRERLAEARVPWVIENVQGAPLDGIMLCGQMFGLVLPDGRPVYRHRLFESTVPMLAPGHPRHYRIQRPGSMLGQRASEMADGMGIDWMTKAGRGQAIPPAYTEWVGQRLLDLIEFERAA
jgi:DNA (cytosine-5)-methyltransferase 1